MQHLKNRQAGGSGVATCFITHSEDVYIEILEVGFETVGAACKQRCTKSDEKVAKPFVKAYAGSVENHEIRRDELSTLSRQISPDASKAGVAVLTDDEARSDGGETRKLTVLGAAEQSSLLDVSDDTCETDVVPVQYVPVLLEKTATAGGGGITIKEEKRLSGGGGFV